MQSMLITGATVSLYVNGVPYAGVIDIHYNIDTPGKEIRGCDAPQPFEIAPTTSAVSMTMTIYRRSQDGGAEGAGLAVPISQISKSKYVALQVVEKRSNTVLFETRRAYVTNQAWSVATHSFVLGSLTFTAIDYQNEVRAAQ